MDRDFPILRIRFAALVVVLAWALVAPAAARAHCDTMDGPVIAAAKLALEKSDVTPVLKWIKPEAEPEVREVFAKALAARRGGPAARELADRYFFETLVRIHRSGEGAPYTGLLPSGTAIEPAIVLADKSLTSGDPTELSRAMTRHVEEGIRQRFARAAEARKHADESVSAGREYVAAYVEYTHYVERLHADATGAAHASEAAAAGEHRH
jgi:hypothetical protein